MTVVVTHTTPADSSFSAAGAAAWNADHTLSGVGTMAGQDANAVAITGGTIDNTTLGATTPSTGVFTTLTATGQTSLGGVAGSESFRATSVASAVNWIQAAGNTAGTGPILSATGSDTNVDFLYSAKGTAGSHVFRTNTTTRQFQITHTASAVNYVQVTGAATGASPVISMQGSDSAIPMVYAAKGGASHQFFGSTGGTNQFQISNTSSAVNRYQATGSTTGNGVVFSAVGTDTNISQVFQSKGTGAIDLAAGSSGVNISNGGTVTAITRTAAGTFYTSIPTLTVSPPTTAGGVQATATPQMAGQTVTVQAAGTGYVVGNTLTVVGGTSSTAAQLRVDSIDGSGGVTATSFVNTAGAYSVLPTNPVSVTGGAGSSATFNITQWFFASVGPLITNAGSGYVEQPTVTFSGGGGSGAAAYASVGSFAVIKAIGSGTGVVTNQAFTFQTPNSITSGNPAFIIRDAASFDSWYQMGPSSTQAFLTAKGNANASAYLGANGSGSIRLTTNGDSITEQMRVSHTASAVNYVQVTGAATGGAPVISAQGSDAAVALGFTSKSTSAINFLTNSGNQRQLQINHTASAVNYWTLTGSAAGSAPVLSVAGSDTNIDLTLTPKGTGNVRFGTYTGTILTPTGYVEIKDSGGTIRRLLVG